MHRLTVTIVQLKQERKEARFDWAVSRHFASTGLFKQFKRQRLPDTLIQIYNDTVPISTHVKVA